MLLVTDPEHPHDYVTIRVFSLTNEKIELIGFVNQYTSLSWSETFVGAANVELWAPATDENVKLLKVGAVLNCGSEVSAIIESIVVTNSDGVVTLDVKGRTLESLLDRRVIWSTQSFTSKQVSTIMFSLFNTYCINTSVDSRKFPNITVAADPLIGDKISVQFTWKTLTEAFEQLCESYGLGYKIGLYQEPSSTGLSWVFRFEIVKSKSNNFVFDSAVGHLTESTYTIDKSAYKNLAWTAGEGEGSDRTSIQVSNDYSASGYDLYEVYVDARDLQKEDGTSQEDYMLFLEERGLEKLDEYNESQTYTFTLNTGIEVEFQVGDDFDVGHEVIITDRIMGVQVNKVISQITAEISSSKPLTYSLSLGDVPKTLYRVINRKFIV